MNQIPLLNEKFVYCGIDIQPNSLCQSQSKNESLETEEMEKEK
jgi:hypothetical protein